EPCLRQPWQPASQRRQPSRPSRRQASRQPWQQRPLPEPSRRRAWQPSTRSPWQEPWQRPWEPRPSPPASWPEPSRSSRQPLVDLLHGDQVVDRADHPANLGTVLLHNDVTDTLEAERAQSLAVLGLGADAGLLLSDLEARHQCATPAALARSIAAGATSSTALPRRAATASGCSSRFSASTVAWTMLIALEEPSDLDSTSWMPAHSSTARTGPPAITPVPGAAG